MARSKYPVTAVYRGKPVAFVDRTATELRAEVLRVRAAVSKAELQLSRGPWRKHRVLRAVMWQLQNVPQPDVSKPPDELAQQLAALSIVLWDTQEMLSWLRNCKLHWLERVRTTVAYGSAFVKKDLNEKRSPRV